MGSWAIRLLLALGGVATFALHLKYLRSKAGGRSVLPHHLLGGDPWARPLSLSPHCHCWAPRWSSHFRGHFGSGAIVGTGSGNLGVPTSRSDRLASTRRSTMSHPPNNHGNEPSTDPAFWTNDVDGFELRDPPMDDRHALAQSSPYLPLPSRNFRHLVSPTKIEPPQRAALHPNSAHHREAGRRLRRRDVAAIRPF